MLIHLFNPRKINKWLDMLLYLFYIGKINKFWDMLFHLFYTRNQLISGYDVPSVLRREDQLLLENYVLSVFTLGRSINFGT